MYSSLVISILCTITEKLEDYYGPHAYSWNSPVDLLFWWVLRMLKEIPNNIHNGTWEENPMKLQVSECLSHNTYWPYFSLTLSPTLILTFSATFKPHPRWYDAMLVSVSRPQKWQLQISRNALRIPLVDRVSVQKIIMQSTWLTRSITAKLVSTEHRGGRMISGKVSGR